MKNTFRLPQLALLLALTLSVDLAHANNSTIAPTAPGDTAMGITFFKGSWGQLMAEAKKQNKPVFVDVYTTWCGPCKKMAKEAFPDPKVGKVFNANFISYQLDAEKGEGIALAKKYAVTGYPTSIYVSAAGDLLHRAVGYGGPLMLIMEANKAITAAKDPKPIAVWDKEFASGKRDAEFLKAYLIKRAALGMPNADALEAYLTVTPPANWTINTSLDILAGNLTTANSKVFKPLLRVMKRLRTDGQPGELYYKIVNTTRMVLQQDTQLAKTEADLAKTIENQLAFNETQATKPLTPGEQTATVNSLRMNFYQRTKNIPLYRDLSLKYGNGLLTVADDSLATLNKASYQRFLDEAKGVPDSVKNSSNFIKYDKMMKTIETQQLAFKLNNLAFAYVENMTAPAELKQALAWSARSLELERNAPQLDTYAQLLGKLGRKAEAIRHEEEAIANAKAAGNDTADYEKTLTALKK